MRSDASSLRNGLRATLVVAQVSLAMVLLIGAGLLVRSAILMQRVDPGFDSHNVLIAGINLPEVRYPSDTAAAARLDDILRGVSSIPGVASTAYVSLMPIAASGTDCAWRREGSTEHDGAFDANARIATPSYFQTLRIPLLRGRMFGASDVPDTPMVGVINQRLAHELFGDENPIGRRITCAPVTSTKPSWLTVVGVTRDLHANGLADQVRDEVYMPATQRARHDMTLVVRGAVRVGTLSRAIRRAVAALDPLLPVPITTMDEIIDDTLAAPRFTSQLLSALGLLGLVLAVIGIYGVIAYFVAQRTNEIGIRMALGAGTGRVIAMVVRQGMLLAAIGIAIGSAAALFVTRMLQEQLFGVTTRDPFTFVSVALLIAVVSLAASYLPALRAARVDPLEALRRS